MPNLARAGAGAPADVDALQRDLADLKQIDKKTQDTLEAVHGTLGLMVDRLAMIETDMRGKSASAARPPRHPPRRRYRLPCASGHWQCASRPDGCRQVHRRNHRHQISSRRPAIQGCFAGRVVARPDLAGRAGRGPISAPPQARPRPPAAERRPIDPNLPPDHPLEPGFGATRGRSPGSPADRIAASEAALGPAKPPVIADPGGKSNFIAAARRAAQAAATTEASRANGPQAAAGPAAASVQDGPARQA